MALPCWVLVFFVSVSAVASDFNDGVVGINSNSRIEGPPFKQIAQSLKALALSYPSVAQAIEYGETPLGQKLTILKIARKDLALGSGKAIFIGGSIHGNEYLNIEDRLPEWFLTEGLKTLAVRTFIDQGGALYLAPILNPDGYDQHIRENNNHEDLNRDFTVVRGGVNGFHQPETAQLAEYLEKELASRKLVFALDYHCCTGALLHPWSFKGPELSTVVRRKYVEVSTIATGIFGRGIKTGTTPDVLGYDAFGTSKDYYFEKYGALAFTFEGREGKENRYFSEHTKMWEEFLNYVNTKL